MPEAVVQQRIVPGAPPPAPLSKSQKKKRRTKAGGKSENDDTAPGTPEVNVASAPLLEKAPEPSEVNEGSIAPEPIARTESQGATLPEEDVLLKPSPIVDLVYKRLKVTTKKISRITIYAATDPEKLNDDQKRTLKTLPTLEAIQKELSEVKKAIETHEADLVQELAVKRHEADKAEKARIASAVSSAETSLVSKTNTLLDIIRLRSSLASGLDITSIADATEITAIISAADALVSEDEARKQAAVESILLGRDFEGVGSSRLLEITQLAYNPPRAPTPLPEEPVAEEQPAEPVAEPQVEEEHPVIGVPPSTTTGSFRFMQDSEIEASNTNFEEEAEWVEKSDAVGHDAPSVNGHASQEAVLADAGPIDWAADEEAGLPSIAGLQAEFGTSGSVTPAEVPEARTQPEAVAPSPAVNGGANSTAEHAEDDGFTQAKSRGRGRGSGFRGEGRGGRGGYRGGDRGGYRGGERGGFRGDRGNYRGGEGRGGFRGGERGNFRGGERGGFRGGEGRGRGEWRGEGRGRGRGRGGPPGTPATPAPPV